MADFKCPFCNSNKLMVDTPYIKKDNTWPIEYKKQQTYCCRTQAKNQEYIKKKYHPIFSEKKDDVSKL